MDKNRLDRLMNRAWIGSQLKKFCADHGLGNLKAAIKRTGYTNMLNAWEGNVFPSWDNLVSIAEGCESDLETLMSYLDPGEPFKNEEIVIAPEHRQLVRMLLAVLTDANEEGQVSITNLIKMFHDNYAAKPRSKRRAIARTDK